MNRPITFRTLIITNGLTVLLLVAALLVTSTLAGPALQVTPASSSDNTTTINYQGHLTDSAGEPINGTLPMTFKLYRDPSGGTAVWTEQRSGGNAVPVSDGLFSVSLGSVTPVDLSLFGEPLWLGISVNGDAEMTPRERLDGGAIAVGPRLLGENTCGEGCGAFTETSLSSWNTIKGADVHDPIEVTVTTSGRPVIAYMTARFHMSIADRAYCRISVYRGDTLVDSAHLEGSDDAVKQFACSGSYLFTDLEPGTYSFRARAFFAQATDVSWEQQRQIAVFEY